MRKTVVLTAAAAALVVPAGAALAQAQLPQLPQLPTHVTTVQYVDPSLVRIDLDTSDGLRAALHLAGRTVLDLDVGDYVGTDIMTISRPLLRSLDLDCGTQVMDCASFIVARISSMPRPAVPSTAAVVSTVTTTVSRGTATVAGITTQVQSTVTTIRSAIPTPPTVQLPPIAVPAAPAIPALPAAPAPDSLLGFVGATVDATVATVGNTVDAVVGSTPTVPTAPEPRGLLEALLG